jgi:hypothetical protein
MTVTPRHHPRRSTLAILGVIAGGTLLASIGIGQTPAPSGAVPVTPVSTVAEFTIFVYETKAEIQRRESANAQAYWGEYAIFGMALRESGVLVGGSAIEPPSNARVVRVRDGKATTQPRTHTDTEERLGGYFIIRAKDMDEAAAWAAKCPGAATGSVEVRANVRMDPAAMK